MDKVEEKLTTNNIRPTAMRILVLQYLMQEEAAHSLKQLEEAFSHADRSTLYRTLKTFEESKIIHSIDDGSGMIKYGVCLEGCNCNPEDQHYHFHCVSCEATFCLTSMHIPQIDLPANFKMQQANMVIKGTCAHCNT